MIRNKIRKNGSSINRNSETYMYDMSCEMALFPTEKESYCILCVNGSLEYISEFEKQGLISDYHYQNQFDKPEDISDEDWDQREKD